MSDTEPVARLDARFSGHDARPADWAEALWQLDGAEVFWLSTVRPDGRPHVTPVLSVWLDGALYFCTGPGERKAQNLGSNPYCVLTTGSNALDGGLDLVMEGEASTVWDRGHLGRVAAAYAAKYGRDWRIEVVEGALYGEGGAALVYRVTPSRAFGFTKGRFSQTRWRFADDEPAALVART
jgi:hypothetical protein